MPAVCVLNIYFMEHSPGTVVLLFQALENDLDNVLIYALESFLNCDLNSDPITVLIMDPIIT